MHSCRCCVMSQHIAFFGADLVPTQHCNRAHQPNLHSRPRTTLLLDKPMRPATDLIGRKPDCQTTRAMLRRFRVVYRLANQVYVMGVAPAHGNVLFAARVVNAATHHLVAVNRGIGVTPDRVANRFPEVCGSSWCASPRRHRARRLCRALLLPATCCPRPGAAVAVDPCRAQA